MQRTIIVKKRFGDEAHEVREFIRPEAYQIARFSDMLWRRTHNIRLFTQQAYQFITENVRTPTGNLANQDWHSLSAFIDKGSSAPLVTYTAHDFWAYPSETFTCRIGDCDDKSILLVSILRRYIHHSRVFCTVGTFRGAGHMWVTVEGHVFETTAKRSITREASPYEAMFRFNDRVVIKEKPLRDTPLV